MCGITGWVDFTSGSPPQDGVLVAMTRTLSCRGPDAEGFWSDANARLGHRRLAVVDPVGGAQPMLRERDGARVALSFCGEVYNFVELRRELAARGHRFETDSDTEVLLACYLEWEADFPRRLDGMFAAAIWDARERRLLLVRDRLGVKPLYLHHSGGRHVFGSEPKALLAHPAVSSRVDGDGLYELLDPVRTPGRSVFRDIGEVVPGTLVQITATGVTEHRYWTLDPAPHSDGVDDTVDRVGELLGRAVSRQLTADVPLGALLSGGIDSSVVSALAARDHHPLATFSVDFQGAEAGFVPDSVRSDSDTPFAREVARHLGSAHTEVVLRPEDVAAEATRRAVLAAVDHPPSFWGDMWPSLYLFFRRVKEDVSVVLSGEGADELFGGYVWFHHPAAAASDTFPWLTPGFDRFFGDASLLAPELLRVLEPAQRRKQAYAEALRETPVLDDDTPETANARRANHMALTRYLPTLLDRKDRMSMAVGLEARVPFCDHHLVEYVFNVPWHLKALGGREKGLLRAAAGHLLPSSVRERRKTPYPATQDQGYAAALGAGLADVLADPDSPVLPLLDVPKARRAVDRTAAGRPSRPHTRGGLEMALWLNDWLRTYDVALELP